MRALFEYPRAQVLYILLCPKSIRREQSPNAALQNLTHSLEEKSLRFWDHVHITFYAVRKKVTAPMTINPTKPFEEMTPDELNEVFREVKKLRRDQPYKLPGIRIAGYIPPDWAEHLEISVDYAWRKGMIKHKTTFSFTTWCVKQVISSIIVEIRRERTNPPLEVSQN